MINLLLNGGFDGNLNEWSGTGTIARSLGYPRLGCVQLAAGQSIYQAVGLSADTLYTCHFFYYPTNGGASVTVTYGSVSQGIGGNIGAWNEGVVVFALDASEYNNLTFSGNGATVYLDSVALGYGGLPITRSDAAARLERRLGALATDAEIERYPSEYGPEGDYSEAIDEALRAIGAVSRLGDPDVTTVRPEQVNDLLEGAQMAMLQRLRSSYALETDVSLGPRKENRSQIAASIDAMLGGGGSGGSGNRRVSQGSLGYSEWRR